MTTNQTQLDLIPSEIATPPLWLKEKFLKVGSIIARVSGNNQFTYSTSEAIPRRRTNPAREYKSQDGVRLLVTTTATDKKLDGYQSILLRNNDEDRWLHHDELESLKVDLQNNPASKVRDEICESWANQFTFKNATSSLDGQGLRPPQLGALHATLAHWSLSTEPVTVVMPTGTGKTETMLSLMVVTQPKCVLVVVPSKALRDQIAEKFATLGILLGHGIVKDNVRTPVVGVIEHELRSQEDLSIFDRCNIVVSVVNSVANGKSVPFLEEIAKRCSHLVFDEAHHVPAASWSRLKDVFKGQKILQFTATPFREDRSPVGGKVIYNYPLSAAQEEGYFKPITFKGVFEISKAQADSRIAEEAVAQLREDLRNGHNHRLLARCKTIERATEVLKIYEDIAVDLNPTIVHSKSAAQAALIKRLREGTYKIVVTVDMLKEGFDMPELKVAAIHDTFKSLAVTLQFAGRFPRVGDDSVGLPTVVANTGLDEMKSSLQGLYDEDADWNQLLSNLSFEKVAEQERFEEFLHSSQDLSDGEISEDSIAARLNKNTLVYKFNTVVYKNAQTLNQFGIHKGLENKHRFVRAWENRDKNVVFFVTRLVDCPDWTNTKNLEDSILNLFVIYHNADKELLFIGSSFKSLTGHQKLAQAVSGDAISKFEDEEPYRVFDGIDHLVLHQVGLLTGGGARNVRYSMFSGSDVRDAISRILSNQSKKSNIYGVGFRNGRPLDLGCSRKGKVWCREAGSLNQWIEWCDTVGTHLLNTSYDTSTLIDNVLIPEPIEQLPNKQPWFFEWPERLNRYRQTSVTVVVGETKHPFHHWKLSLADYDTANERIEFAVTHADDEALNATYELKIIGGDQGFLTTHLAGPEQSISIGKQTYKLTEYFYSYPPILTFTDHCEMEGARLVDPAFTAPSFSEEQCTVRDWSQSDIRKESRWKDGFMREDSIQAQALRWCQEEGFDIIFDDDGANEIADIIAIREETDALLIRLLHCKYSSENDPGARVKDIIEVTSQAVKNYDWLWQTEKMARRMLDRHSERSKNGAGRFYEGSPILLKKLVRLSKEFRKTKNEVLVVQPGVSFDRLTPQMNSIFGSADSYLRVRAGCPLTVWCS